MNARLAGKSHRAIAVPVLGAGDILLGALTLSAERSHFRRPSIGQLSDIPIDGAQGLTSLFGGDTTIFTTPSQGSCG